MQQADVEKYIRKVSPQEDAVLTAMERYARHRRFPIIGPLAGRFLHQLTLMSNARRVLELGSGFGYSAYWFALAMGRGGRITMIDFDPANLERAREYFKQGNLKTRRVFIAGDALKAAATLTGPYDIIFNDIDKHQYPETIDIAARVLKRGDCSSPTMSCGPGACSTLGSGIARRRRSAGLRLTCTAITGFLQRLFRSGTVLRLPRGNDENPSPPVSPVCSRNGKEELYLRNRHEGVSKKYLPKCFCRLYCNP